MMYSNRFIASVRVGGKILRENQGTVTLPFGAEYELLLKNMNSRRAMVRVSVDGVDVTDGTRLIIRPNDTISLERFIKNGNFSSGNRLKFIERTGGIETHRGIKQDDGLIRCEFWAEKEAPQEIHQTIVQHRHYVDRDHYYYWPNPYPWNHPWNLGGGSLGLSNTQVNTSGSLGSSQGTDSLYGRAQGSGQMPGSTVTHSANMAQNTTSTSRPQFTASAGKQRPIQAKAMRGPMGSSRRSRPMRSFGEETRSALFNDAGITVPGSESHQQFYSATGFPIEETSHVIVLQLRGDVGGVVVVNPVTVDLKPTCSSCGRVNKATNKFCSQCGTALFLI